jgi:hypothetical protein
MGILSKRPEVIPRGLEDVAEEVRSTIGATALYVVSAFGEQVGTELWTSPDDNHRIFGTRYDDRVTKTGYIVDERMVLPAFPTERIEGVSIWEEVLESKSSDDEGLVMRGPGVVRAIATLNRSYSNSNRVEQIMLGIATNGDVSVPKHTYLSRTDFEAPAQHVVGSEPATKEEVLSRFIGGYQDSLVVADTMAAMVDDTPRDAIADLYAHLADLGVGLEVPKLSFTQEWALTQAPGSQ